MSADDLIRAEAERIADSYGPLTAGDRQAARDLAADDKGDVIAYAKRYVAPYLDVFLERVVRDARKGGRNTEKSFDLMAWLALGYSSRGDINLFFQQLGATQEEARRALDTVQRTEALDERGAAEVCARFLRGYMERCPEMRETLWRLLGAEVADGGNGEAGTREVDALPAHERGEDRPWNGAGPDAG